AWAGEQSDVRWRVGFVVVATFRYTGLRLDELVTLRLDKLDLTAGQLSVIGKGRKHRVVPVMIGNAASVSTFV
ncbi:MAG TPA: tyrosine-type recombinase/integrase, partial [Mycobacterium sp.]|nr:tyrosine-type recombinase/integrase [Mycobacterium sp.]